MSRAGTRTQEAAADSTTLAYLLHRQVERCRSNTRYQATRLEGARLCVSQPFPSLPLPLPSIVLTYGSSISVQTAQSGERRRAVRGVVERLKRSCVQERGENDSHSAFII